MDNNSGTTKQNLNKDVNIHKKAIKSTQCTDKLILYDFKDMTEELQKPKKYRIARRSKHEAFRHMVNYFDVESNHVEKKKTVEKNKHVKQIKSVETFKTPTNIQKSKPMLVLQPKPSVTLPSFQELMESIYARHENMILGRLYQYY